MPFPSDKDLADYKTWAQQDLRGNLGQQAAARRMLEVLGEVAVARGLIRGLYHHMAEAKGEEPLQAELERYDAALGVVKAAV